MSEELLRKHVMNALIINCCTDKTRARIIKCETQNGKISKLNADKTTIELVKLCDEIVAAVGRATSPVYQEIQIAPPKPAPKSRVAR